MSDPVDLWLDDMRPAPVGWVHVKTVKEAALYLAAGNVRRASLDHDLGACDACNGRDVNAWLEEHDYKSMPHCTHVGTGYELVCWMEETGIWPRERPTVHSNNPAGRARMLQAIARRFDRVA